MLTIFNQSTIITVHDDIDGILNFHFRVLLAEMMRITICLYPWWNNREYLRQQPPN